MNPEYDAVAHYSEPVPAERPPLYEQVAVLAKRVAELEEYLKRTEDYMRRVGRELGI